MRDGRIGLACALAVFVGCLVGLSMPCDAVGDMWVDALCVLAALLSLAAWLLRHRARTGCAVAILAFACIGSVRAGHVINRSAEDCVQGHPRSGSTLVRFRARCLESPSPPDRADADLLDRFQASADEPRLLCEAELVHLRDASVVRPASGCVTLVMPGISSELIAGDVVDGTGWLTPVEPAQNPGENDRSRQAWKRGWVGQLRLERQPDVVAGAPWPMRIRAWLQRTADENLVSAIDEQRGGSVTTLVVAMTTGRKLPGYASLRGQFAATGLSHFLAISGFNVAVLFGVCAVCMEAARVRWWLRGWALAASGVIFLTVVDVEVSVLRAGVAGVMAGCSLGLGRAWRADGLLAAAAIGTLLADPWCARNIGFQLSYAAVLALRYGSGPVDQCLAACWPCRWTLQSGRALACVRTVRIALSASLAAWIVSTPITLLAFGSISPWCAIASTLLGPIAALLTVLASLLVVAGWVPVIGSTVGWVSWMLGWVFLHAVQWIGTWPLCMVMVSNPVFDMAPVTPPPNDVVEWVALSVGDGSVHMIRCGGAVVVYDAGSISRNTVGSAVVVPALRALGVSRIDAIVVSHPHLDHYSAVPEIILAMPVDRVVVTEAWQRSIDPAGAAACLMSWLVDRAVKVECMVEGDVLRQGPLTWRAVHPRRGWVPGTVNDGSLGFIIEHRLVPDRPAILLLGDAQDEAIARCLARRDILRPFAMELPHHGGWRPIAQALCEWVRPDMVVQSTGQRRFARDRFDAVLRDTPRGVTCAMGAIRFTLDPQSAVEPARLERWLAGRWVPVVRP